ncbi:hypothetical protein lerEdw1_006801 [Lerista edwardsae]|nr:hypothetical protein lerEdw1_006801 [Lerista edwardsae]
MALEAAPLSRLRSRRAALLRKGVSFEGESAGGGGEVESLRGPEPARDESHFECLGSAVESVGQVDRARDSFTMLISLCCA